MSFWTGKRVLVTGGAGFIGSHVVDLLIAHGAKVLVTYRDGSRLPNLADAMQKCENLVLLYADLTRLDDALAACRGVDVVINLAGVVGGVAFNSINHGKLYRENVLIQAQMLEAARQRGVERFLMVSSACVYAREAQVPNIESEGFLGLPEETNRGYGLAKRAGEQLAQAYAKQYGMQIAIARPFNAYGPRDKFGGSSSHVISGIIPRFAQGDFTVWGDGSPTRSFIYVEDLARGLLEVAENYAICDPVNLGSDEEVSIRQLAEKISGNIGFAFLPNKPMGQPRRACDTRKALEKIGFRAETSLDDGIKQTVAWYQAQGVLA